jgi:hypothetical protein
MTSRSATDTTAWAQLPHLLLQILPNLVDQTSSLLLHQLAVCVTHLHIPETATGQSPKTKNPNVATPTPPPAPRTACPTHESPKTHCLVSQPETPAKHKHTHTNTHLTRPARRLPTFPFGTVRIYRKHITHTITRQSSTNTQPQHEHPQTKVGANVLMGFKFGEGSGPG